MLLEVVDQIAEVVGQMVEVVVQTAVAADQMGFDVGTPEVAHMHPVEGIAAEAQASTIGMTYVFVTEGDILWSHSSR
jgi:hypothetical protein